MPIFQYRAIGIGGKKIQGVIDADSISLAKEKLRKEKVMVIKLGAMSEKREAYLPAPKLLAFTREMSQLLKAGLPLYESLLTIEEKYQKHKFHCLLLDLCDRLKSGHLLSTALKSYPKTFDKIYISMVESGENTGSLAWVFEQLYQLIERKQHLKKQLISAMAYPAFLGGFCTLMVLSLLLFVIPSMQDLFEGRALHPLTAFILSLSNFLKTSLHLILLSIGLIVFSLIHFFKKKKGKDLFEKNLHKIPLVKSILKEAALIRFCRSSSILLFGGVPLIQSLAIARGVMKHSLLEEAIIRAEKNIVEGTPLSTQLKESPHMPPLMSRMLSIAEETGKLPEMLHSLSEIYDEELERSLTQITTFLQPILLLILGGVVGLVILSILLPLTDVSSIMST